MAKFAYDVNTTRRIIDVHKQFRGGLKTVDTDDALKDVFLRQAENISLSEFGFIEKRYGTFEKFAYTIDRNDSQFTLQGYWEFLGKYAIAAVNGHLYYRLLSSSPSIEFTKVTQFYTKSTLTYPKNLAEYLGLESDFSAGSGFGSGFQNTRPMGAVNISDVLYVFTGKYPVYIVEEDDVLKVYLYAKKDPTYAELVVTGHNLLENDYEELYFGEVTEPEAIAFLSEDQIAEEKQFVIKDGNFSPKIPFAQKGELNILMSYDYH